MAGILKSRLSEPQDIQDSPELQEEQEIDTEAENSINEEAASRHKKNKKNKKRFPGLLLKNRKMKQIFQKQKAL